jgi:hypothetical protein
LTSVADIDWLRLLPAASIDRSPLASLLWTFRMTIEPLSPSYSPRVFMLDSNASAMRRRNLLK